MDIRKLTPANLKKRIQRIDKVLNGGPEGDGLAKAAAKDTPVIRGLLAEVDAFGRKKKLSHGEEIGLVILWHLLQLLFALREIQLEEESGKKVRRKRKGSA
jgi:hypothetical protein